MKYGNCLPLALVLAAAPPLMSATKDQELPDKEMLRMMEFLREIEMIKHMEIMRDMPQVESVGAQTKDSPPRKPTITKKEAAK